MTGGGISESERGAIATTISGRSPRESDALCSASFTFTDAADNSVSRWRGEGGVNEEFRVRAADDRCRSLSIAEERIVLAVVASYIVPFCRITFGNFNVRRPASPAARISSLMNHS